MCLLWRGHSSAGAASQAGDADSSLAHGLGLCLGVYEYPPWYTVVCATVTVHQFFRTLHLHESRHKINNKFK